MSTFQYEDSRVFADLKNIKERIPGNMTTYQYLVSYDSMLDNALRPIIRDTKFLDAFLLRVLGWQEKNFRRKVSFLPRREVPRLVLNFLVAPDEESRVQTFTSVRLDRGLRMEALELFFAKLSEYERACNLELSSPLGEDTLSHCLYVKSQVEAQLGSSSSSLLPALREARHWMGVAAGFKQKLLEKYVRLCLTTAQRDYTQFFDCSVKLDDLIQTYLMATSRAIDKCDYKQGVLTSHVQNWLFTARDAMVKMRDKDNISLDHLSLEDLDPLVQSEQESNVMNNDRVEVLARLARLADPLGAARCYLQLPEPGNCE
jgi:hypothetical protein